jgi:hypothetical protein
VGSGRGGSVVAGAVGGTVGGAGGEVVGEVVGAVVAGTVGGLVVVAATAVVSGARVDVVVEPVSTPCS